MDLTALDHSPMSVACIRCQEPVQLRFVGLCEPCRDALHEKFPGVARDVSAEEYVPKVNVTANAVALKDD